MAINKLVVNNFKSFRKAEIKLEQFNILIGANASGKSNFIQIFKFLRDVMSYGLDNAISMQGGIEYIRNTNIGSSEDFSVKFNSDVKSTIPLFLLPTLIETEPKGEFMGGRVYNREYEFTLRFKRGGVGFEILNENLINWFSFPKGSNIPSGKAIIYRDEKKYTCELQLETDKTVPIIDDTLTKYLLKNAWSKKALLIEQPTYVSDIYSYLHDISDMAVYDFDPKLGKKAVTITGKTQLAEDGSNLAISLKKILQNKKKKRKFSNLIKDLLPFIDDWNVANFLDKSITFKTREKYSPHSLPAVFLSDGTINITALIVALYFEEKPLIIVEEPERNIHPFLISKVVNMLKESSKNKQIIVTTHNPEILRHAHLEDVHLISRDKEGFSNVTKPKDNKDVQLFLKNDIGLDELYIKNLLGA